MNTRNESLYTNNIAISKIIYTKFIFSDLTGSHEQCEPSNTTDGLPPGPQGQYHHLTVKCWT